jgi:dolichyl-phosphate beta-glucosyltransferase
MKATVCIIVPCFNEAERLPLEEWRTALTTPLDRSWVLVNDGSSDGTLAVLKELARPYEQVKVLDLPVNQGKAEAVRQGVLWALQQTECRWVAYLDADLATPTEELWRLFENQASRPQVQGILGSRIQRLGTRIERRALRHYLGRCAATAISLMLRLPTYDTQCGAKLIRRDLAEKVFAQPFTSRWLFDAELIARARNLVGRSEVMVGLVEEPLEVWHEKPGSKIRLVDLVRLPRELWQLHKLYNGSDRRGNRA